ncbi:MAG: hypothetical protein WDN06_18060 [Asticcacaulis sp.]
MRFARIAAAGLTFLAAAAGAAPVLETKQIPVEKAFPFLQNYYALKAHDRFRLDFFVVGDLPPSFHMALKRKSGDVPVTVAPDRRFLPLPDAQDFASHTPLEVTSAKDTKIALTVKISETLAPAKTLDARVLAASVTQVRDGVKTMAGLMALLVPDYKSVCFDGARSGTVTLADGKSVALKLSKKAGDAAIGSPCFTPADYGNAVQVTLDRVPSGMYITPRQP